MATLAPYQAYQGPYTVNAERATGCVAVSAWELRDAGSLAASGTSSREPRMEAAWIEPGRVPAPDWLVS